MKRRGTLTVAIPKPVCEMGAVSKVRGRVTVSVVGRTRRGDVVLAVGLLSIALLQGGGSADSPIQRTLVEFAGVVAMGWIFVRGRWAPLGRSARAALALIAALVLLVIVHLIPLPPGLWRGLPGRGVVADVLDVVGAHAGWLPLSVDPAATREVGYFLIPPIAMFLATLRIDRKAQLKLLLIVAIAAFVSALLVMVQTAGASWLTLYDLPDPTKGQGLFANKNHNVALLNLSIPIVALFARDDRWLPFATRARTARYTFAGILIIVLVVAVLGCLSRAGVALLPLSLATCVPLLGGWRLIRRHWLVAFAALLLLALAAGLIAKSSIVGETFDRFDASREGRYIFWPDVVFTIRQFMPWGSGLGTFVPVFRINESLVGVTPYYTNHAHSDYMEIVLEAGIPGLILVAAFLGWFVATAWSRLRARIGTTDFPPMLTAVVGMVILLAASVLDYPLRTLSLACVFAVLAAMLASSDLPIRPTDGEIEERPR